MTGLIAIGGVIIVLLILLITLAAIMLIYVIRNIGKLPTQVK